VTIATAWKSYWRQFAADFRDLLKPDPRPVEVTAGDIHVRRERLLAGSLYVIEVKGNEPIMIGEAQGRELHRVLTQMGLTDPSMERFFDK